MDHSVKAILEERRELGEALREKILGGGISRNGGVASLCEDGEAEFCWGTIWTRPALSTKTKCALALAMTSGLSQLEAVQEYAKASLNAGWSAAEIAEILLHVQCYAGLNPARSAAEAAVRALGDAGMLVDPPDRDSQQVTGIPGERDREYTSNPLELLGLRVRRQALGASDINRWMEKTAKDPFMSMFFDVTHEYCFAKVWARPALEFKLRSMLSLSITAVHGYTGAIRRHSRSCVEAGLSKEEIGEVLLLVYVYGGVYCALSAFITANEVFDELTREGILVRERRSPDSQPL